MKEYGLIVSNPPHGDVDYGAIAPRLGLCAAEVRMKANYGVPEIWLAEADRSTAEVTAAELTRAGLRVAVVGASELNDIPPQASVFWFEFADQGLVLDLGHRELTLDYDTPLAAVFCEPRVEVEPQRRSTSHPFSERLSHNSMTVEGLVGLPLRSPSEAAVSADTDHAEWGTFVDIYGTKKGEVRRFSVIENAVDFSSLEHLEAGGEAKNIERFLMECGSRFAGITIDRRLVNVRVRQRPMVGEGNPNGSRKGFSYATKALTQLLESISPTLGQIGQNALASRLAYLTIR